MGYVIVGGVCLGIGAIVGIFTMALISVNRNTEEYRMENCSHSATHNIDMEVKQDADR